jgi:hypothetical protein
MLLSSTLIYNNTGVFNQDAVEKLAYPFRMIAMNALLSPLGSTYILALGSKLALPGSYFLLICIKLKL